MSCAVNRVSDRERQIMAKLIHKPDGTITTDSGIPVVIVGKNDYTKDKQNGEK